MSMNPPGGDGENNASDIEQLINAVLEGTASILQSQRLRELLREDPAALDAYVDQARMHAMLLWRHGKAGPAAMPQEPAAATTIIQTKPSAKGWRVPWRRVAVAAVVVIGASLAMFLWPRRVGDGPVVPQAIGTVAEARDLVWGEGQTALATGASVHMQPLSIRSGTLRLALRSDVVVTLSGPAKVQFLSPMRLRADEGRITARVGPAGKGFTVESSAAQVIDQGTEFGVQVNQSGRTDVLVFEGQVDLLRAQGAPATPAASTRSTNTAPAVLRMNKGQGLQVAPNGRVQRIVVVEGRPGTSDWIVRGAPAGGNDVIARVEDNLRDPEEGVGNFYRIVHRGLEEDVPAYVDRCYQWNGVDASGIPPELKGADLVMTFNADKKTPDLKITMTLARPAMLYVFLQAGVAPPEWLVRDFVQTPLSIGLDEGPPDMPRLHLGQGSGQSIDRVFSVWRREVREPGPITLGDNAPVKSMYGIAAKALQ